MVMRASRMHSSAAAEPDQTREKDSRCTANSPTRRPMAWGPRSKSARVGSLPMGSGGWCVGGRRRVARVSQWAMSALRCCRQQTLFMSFCEAGEESRTHALAEGDRQHPQGGVEAEREVRGAVVTEPEMFTPAKFSPVAIESRVEVGRNGFRQEQFAFA